MINRRKFITYSTAAVVIGGVTYYLTTDTYSLGRADLEEHQINKIPMHADEIEILVLASLAPSGHNTQPWFVKYNKPFYWTICNDKAKWLHAVDPGQRETILSIGAFIQNLEFAANNLGYHCEFNVLAVTTQDEDVLTVRLSKWEGAAKFQVEKIRQRRTLRSNYSNEAIRKEDLDYLLENESGHVHFFPNTAKEHLYLNTQTIEANKLQSYRDDAQAELAKWIRFSNQDAERYRDGLTPASMEITGISGWIVRNFYDSQSVMKKDFREKSIDLVIDQVSKSAGWLVITSPDNLVSSLLESGKRLQRIWLKVRDKNIAIHPMTQILEEDKTRTVINDDIGIHSKIQFLLRIGYVADYPMPVTLRRPISWFVRN